MSGKGWEVEGGRFKREGTDVYLCLIHVDIWQKPAQHCKAVILQLTKKYKRAPHLSVSRHEYHFNHEEKCFPVTF